MLGPLLHVLLNVTSLACFWVLKTHIALPSPQIPTCSTPLGSVKGALKTQCALDRTYDVLSCRGSPRPPTAILLESGTAMAPFSFTFVQVHY